MGLVVSLLSGEALDWASSLLEQNSPVLSDWDAFLQAFATIFNSLYHIRSAEAPEASPGQRPATSYATYF